MLIAKSSVAGVSRDLQLEVLEPPVEKPRSYSMTKDEPSALVFTRTLPSAITTWFRVIAVDRRALAVDVRRKLGSFVQDWEAPGMEDYDAL